MKIRTPRKIDVILQDRERLRYPALKDLHALVTGVPSPQTPLRNWTPHGALLRDLGWLAGGMAAAGFGAAALPVAGLAAPLAAATMVSGIALTIGRLRRFVVGHTHEATHGVPAIWYEQNGMSQAKALWVCEAILDFGSALTLTLNGQDYREKHGPHHDYDVGTLGDPDGETLNGWSLWPGKLRGGSFYGTVAYDLLGWRWHLTFLGDRLASNFFKGRVGRRLLAAAVAAGLLAPMAILPFPVWLAMIGLPWTVGYHIAAALQSLTEHPYGFDRRAANDEEYKARTWQRYPYRPMPEPGLSGLRALRAWAGWTLAMVGHVAARTMVYDDTMIHHRFHHNAWPDGVPFYDWWNTPHHYVAWILANPELEELAVWGMPEALALQKARMERQV